MNLKVIYNEDFLNRISELEHEISQYKIEYLYKKFMGNNWMSCGSTQPGETVETHYSLKPYDSNLRTEWECLNLF